MVFGEELIQAVIFGLIEGGVITLGAVGFSLAFGLVGVINFAYGDYMALGAYLTLLGVSLIGFSIPTFLVSIVLASVVVGVFGVIIARYFFKPLRNRSPLAVFLVSFAIALVLRNLIRAIWGQRTQLYGVPTVKSIHVGPFTFPPINVGIGALSLLIILTLFAFVFYTRWGKAMRALSDNREMAQAYGIPTERYISLAWFVSSALAALMGVFLGILLDLTPRLGWNFFIIMFASVVLGGIGSLIGAVVGAFAIGVSMNLSATLLPGGYERATAFVIMVIVLLAKPEGLFGGT